MQGTIGHNNRAFSLVELSIVLVILGLLVGGVLSGQSLIRAAQLRAVTEEFQRYQSASMAFRDKYMAVPGDMTTATDFFGRMTTDGSCLHTTTTAGTTVTANGVCNGDGDGLIGTVFGGTGNVDEPSQFWRHLASAGLIEGSYSGVYTTMSNSCAAPGTASSNCPTSKVGANGQWQMNVYTSIWDLTGAHNYLYLGGTPVAAPHGSPVLSPQEAWNIDTKLDDGLPGSGVVRVRNGTGFTCYNDASTYLLTATDLECNLEIQIKL